MINKMLNARDLIKKAHVPDGYRDFDNYREVEQHNLVIRGIRLTTNNIILNKKPM